MRGTPIPREEIVEETLPAFLSYYDRFDGDSAIDCTGDEYGDVEYVVTRAEWESDRASQGP